MILVFDLFETLADVISMDFNRGLEPFWERHYKDRCSFDEIKAYGEELYEHLLEENRKGLEFPFVSAELPFYAQRFGGSIISMSVAEEAEFLMRCNEVRINDGLIDMLEAFRKEGIPVFVMSNSGFTAGALSVMLGRLGIGQYFEKVWSSADFGRIKPDPGFFGMAVSTILEMYPGSTKNDILYVGDTYKTDIAGAYNAGIRPVWLNRRDEADEYDYAWCQIKDISELKALLLKAGG